MKKNNRFFQFGEDVEGYSIPVLNEREIRAAAGLMFLALLLSLMRIVFKGDFILVKYVIVVFLSDFVIRVCVSPRFSPLLIISRLIVSTQVPEYVGAAQKKFAWKIGLVLSVFMFVHLLILNVYSVASSITCFICLVFLFFESAFGICLGCLVYGWLYKGKVQSCAGGICEVRKKQTIQLVSWMQIVILFAVFLSISLAFLFFNEQFRSAPKKLYSTHQQ